ncbi:hypothetical protein HYX05_03135 [Candidatus Woesearchaeota archaeon]|nr:hypothetical protein [Candidatus Woesearchaeota archaeon]
MLKINLPQGILEKSAYSALPSHQKAEYIHNLLKDILTLNKNGITVSQIEKSTCLGRATIWHHLEILASRGMCFKMDRGDTEVYHSNEIIAALKGLEVKDDYYTYKFSIIKNHYGKFVNIQAQQEDGAGNMVAHSGIMLNSAVFSNILNSLAKINDSHLNEENSGKSKGN